MDATQTPAQIDTRLATLHTEAATISARIDSTLHSVPGAKRTRDSFYGTYHWNTTPEEAVQTLAAAINEGQTFRQRTLDALTALTSQQATLHAEIESLNAIYAKAPWTRAFIVQNGNGHVHASMNCSTCNRNGKSTSFGWLPEWSGKDETEIVAAAGWRACSVCFPTAPLGTPTTLPSLITTDEDRAKAAAKAEREAAKMKRDADRLAKALTTDGSDFVVEYQWNSDARVQRERFKTETAAVQWLVQQKAWGHANDAGWQGAFAAIETAVAAKHGKSVEDVRAEFDAKVAAKIKRDSR